MKIRSDFVTNSSSSSFILARQGELTQKQKQEILEYVERYFLGNLALSSNSSEEEINDFIDEYYVPEDKEEIIRKELKCGKNIYMGYVHFEDDSAEYDLAGIYESIWEILKENDDGNFLAIDDDLDY